MYWCVQFGNMTSSVLLKAVVKSKTKTTGKISFVLVIIVTLSNIAAK